MENVPITFCEKVQSNPVPEFYIKLKQECITSIDAKNHFTKFGCLR